MEIIITTPSGKNILIEPQKIISVDAVCLSQHSWQYCKDHAPFQRVDRKKIEMAFLIGKNSEHFDSLTRNIIEHGCTEELIELVEFAWTQNATWLVLHK